MSTSQICFRRCIAPIPVNPIHKVGSFFSQRFKSFPLHRPRASLSFTWSPRHAIHNNNYTIACNLFSRRSLLPFKSASLSFPERLIHTWFSTYIHDTYTFYTHEHDSPFYVKGGRKQRFSIERYFLIVIVSFLEQIWGCCTLPLNCRSILLFRLHVALFIVGGVNVLFQSAPACASFSTLARCSCPIGKGWFSQRDINTEERKMFACRKFAITFQLDFALIFVCMSLYRSRIYPNAAALPNIELQQRVQEFAELFIELLPHEATMPNCNPIVNYPSTLPSAFLPFALAADSEESLQRARYPHCARALVQTRVNCWLNGE